MNLIQDLSNLRFVTKNGQYQTFEVTKLADSFDLDKVQHKSVTTPVSEVFIASYIIVIVISVHIDLP